MTNNISFVLSVIDKGSINIQKIIDKVDTVEKTTSRANKILSSLGANYIHLNAFRNVVEGVSQALDNLTAPGRRFESAMAELQAITGKSGKTLEVIQQKARQLSKAFGGDAAQVASSYTAILSRLGPEIADSPKALDNMGRHVLTLSKTMQGNVQGAMDALTTAALQYNVSMKDPIQAARVMERQMNIMAAGAKIGSAEVTQVAAALKVAGSAAYNANVSFAEANAAIQVLGKGSYYGSEAGTVLRNVLNKLGEGRFLPRDTQVALQMAGVGIDKLSNKSLSLASRLEELRKIQGDSALMAKLFGTENASAATVLLNSTRDLKTWTQGMMGTHTATEQAAIIMNTSQEVINKWKAYAVDVGITLHRYTKSILPLIQLGTGALQLFSQLRPAIVLFNSLVGKASGKLWYFGRTLAIGTVQLLTWGIKLITVSAHAVGSFILQLLRGQVFSAAFFTRLRMQGALALTTLQRGFNSFSIRSFIQGMAASGVQALKAGTRFIWAGVVGLGTWISSTVTAAAAQRTLNTVMRASPISAIVLGLLAMGTAVYLIIKHWDVLKEWLLNLGRFFLKMNPIYWLIRGIDALFPGFMDTLKGYWEAVTNFFNKLAEKILNAFKWVKDKLLGLLGFGDNGTAEMTLNVQEQIDKVHPRLLLSKDGDVMGAGSTVGANVPGIRNITSGISEGGSRPTNIHINIGKFQDKIEIHTTYVKEGVQDMVRMIEEALMKTVNGVNQVAN